MPRGKRRNYIKPRPKNLPKSYDSWLEVRLHEGPLQHADHHPEKIEYLIEHKYEPDFKYTSEGITYIVESKGRFERREDATKLIWVRKVLPEDHELILIFENPKTKFPGARPRKDGTTMTHSDWADKNKFRWWSEADLTQGAQVT